MNILEMFCTLSYMAEIHFANKKGTQDRILVPISLIKVLIKSIQKNKVKEWVPTSRWKLG